MPKVTLIDGRTVEIPLEEMAAFIAQNRELIVRRRIKMERPATAEDFDFTEFEPDQAVTRKG
ncbi:hypothetical protein [Gloeobacter morelensis]|uniref:Uncharacterized protein n=1 Tax=Gloeobacter morelensis MG652769 TaxID=2781736 RepID=A0ABY3PN69_9CYAN|nr:hypothetical protein [Gloeobacter morelensis]UFP95091.1 hypothetical protein ISF26_02235 [Gloeobacter morelensis MG652769]